MNRRLCSVLLASLILAMPSCSGNTGSPVQPNPSDPLSASSTPASALPDGTQLWGLWDVEWNSDSNTFDAVPLRSAEFAVNVIKFINKSPMNLTINVNSIVHDTGFVNFDLEIGIKHPFPGLEIYTGFDVMGVLMGQGSATYPGPEGFPVAGPNDQQLLNPDGYTRRFNAPEFGAAGQILPLQGYFPGNKGSSGYVPTAVLNPYKYYTDGLDATSDVIAFLKDNAINRGCYKPGSTNSRNFKIRMSNSLLKFQYAIIANWEPNSKHPNPPANLDDFPISANSQEAVAISVVDLSDAFFVNTTTYGGDIGLDITAWDWSATCSDAMEEYSIKMYSTAWTGAYDVFMTPIDQAEHRYTFSAKLPAETLTASGKLPVWIEVDYPGCDYTSPVGVPNGASGQLASYFKTEVNILDHDPNPPTNENWIYAIADSGIFANVDGCDNALMFTNMLNLPMTGPFANNKIVMNYRGHTSNYWGYELQLFTNFVTSLGYTYIVVPPNPYVPLDTSGVKMLLLSLYEGKDGEYYTPEEVQTIRDFVNGGGICIIITEYDLAYSYPMGGKDTFVQLLLDLKVDFRAYADGDYHTVPFIDMTPDPITVGVHEIMGACSGRYEVFGKAVSLVQGLDSNGSGIYYTSICKSPLKD